MVAVVPGCCFSLDIFFFSFCVLCLFVAVLENFSFQNPCFSPPECCAVKLFLHPVDFTTGTVQKMRRCFGDKTVAKVVFGILSSCVWMFDAHIFR